MKSRHLAADCTQLAEIEINPLRVLAPGQGVYALDARARRTDPAPELVGKTAVPQPPSATPNARSNRNQNMV